MPIAWRDSTAQLAAISWRGKAITFTSDCGSGTIRKRKSSGKASTQLFVAEACSGLRSLMALGTLAVVFAYFFRRNAVERGVIVLSAIPIAILVNAFRVGLTGYLTHRFGAGAAEGVIHQTEGFFTFGLAFALLLLEAWLLQLFWPRSWRARTGGRRTA